MNPIARGWILYKPDPGLVKQETYEIDRIVAAAPENAYEVEIVSPDEIASREGLPWGPVLLTRHLWEQMDLPAILRRCCRSSSTPRSRTWSRC